MQKRKFTKKKLLKLGILLCIILGLVLVFVCNSETEKQSRAYMDITEKNIEEYLAIELKDPKSTALADVSIMAIYPMFLENWGNVNFVCAYTNHLVEDQDLQRPWLGLFYLADENGNELYNLTEEEHDPLYDFREVKEVKAVDVDEDGLTDIVAIYIYTACSGIYEGLDNYHARIYFQKGKEFISIPRLHQAVKTEDNPPYREKHSAVDNLRAESADLVIEYVKERITRHDEWGEYFRKELDL